MDERARKIHPPYDDTQYAGWTRPVGPTDLTVEMPIPDYARPPGDLAGVLRDHFDGAKQEFSARIGAGVRRQLDEADLFDHDPNNPLQRGAFKQTDHERMIERIRAEADEGIQEFVHQQYLAAHADTQVIPKIEPEVLPGDHRTNYLQTAIDRVREVVDARHPLSPKPEYNLYVVWFCKTLQNWKALVGSTLADGMYYEVTYDGDKGKTYVDIYHKVDQSVIYDPVTHTDETMHKVYAALRETGLSDARIVDAVMSMQNAGILFRERNN